MTRLLPRPVVLLILCSVAAAGLAWWGEPVGASRPLSERVTIRRDTFGIPHISGETEEAAAFGLGYAQAEDHLEAIARRVVRARGEAARTFGPSAIENDFAMRRVDNLGQARLAVRATLGKRFRAVIEAFAAGITHYVRQHRAEVAPWIQEVDAADILAYTRAGAAGGIGSAALVRSLREKYPGGEVPGQPPKPPVAGSALGVDPALDPDQAPDEPGSNALALAGSRTTSGKPILLGNPHLQWSSLYWEAHISVAGRLNFYGSTLVGFPWLRAGFNDRLGYVQTNNAPDLTDVFALWVDPADPGCYLFDGKPRAFQSKDVAVDVKLPDGSLRVERRTYLSSHLGPIVYRTPKLAFAYQSTALDAWRQFESFFDLSHATNLREFLRTLDRGQNPTSNYTYADADGNILYQWNAMLPRRVDDGTSYELDVPAQTSGNLWKKLHRLGDLPRSLNPAGGYIQNANNPPWFVSLRDPIDPARFPSYVERGELALRPQLAIQMLEARERFSPDDVVALKFTTRMLLADRVKPALLEAARAVADPGADLKRGIELLAAWDNHAAAASVGALVFQRAWDTYRAGMPQPYAVPWEATRPGDTPSGIADPARAVKALEDAVGWVRSTYGSEARTWGDAHRYRFGDIDLSGEGASGTYGMYRVQQFEPEPGGKRVAGWPVAGSDAELSGFGDAWVLMVHFTQPVTAWSVLAYGQTTRRDSLHSRDQIRMFAARQLRPIWFTEVEIRAHLEREYRPSTGVSKSGLATRSSGVEPRWRLAGRDHDTPSGPCR
ncbi:MAG: penicillin acylase family protein [Acidobacteria bacterium]|nr:penicillin acylase family protein [Acidobacteriota bacterium]